MSENCFIRKILFCLMVSDRLFYVFDGNTANVLPLSVSLLHQGNTKFYLQYLAFLKCKILLKLSNPLRDEGRSPRTLLYVIARLVNSASSQDASHFKCSSSETERAIKSAFRIILAALFCYLTLCWITQLLVDPVVL